MIDKMNKLDIIAHQQRNPRHFANTDEFLQTVEQEALDAKNSFDLLPQMEQAKEIVSALVARVSAFELNKDQTIQNVSTDVKGIILALDMNPSFTPDEKDALKTQILDIQAKLTCPLTEKGKGGPQEMSDATRYALQVNLSESLSRIAERVQKLRAIDMVTKESFKEWLGRFFTFLKKEFGVLTYTRPDGTFQIIEGIGDAMRRAGEPKRGI